MEFVGTDGMHGLVGLGKALGLEEHKESIERQKVMWVSGRDQRMLGCVRRCG